MTHSLQASNPVYSVQGGHLAIVEPSAAVWDDFTLGHSQGHLLQSSGWAALKKSTGWRSTRVLVVGRDGALAGAQLLTRRMLGVSVAYVPRGPLFATDHEINHLLLATLERLARRSRAICLRLEPNILENDAAAPELHDLLQRLNFQPAPPIMPRSTIHLNLEPPPDQLLAAFRKGHRAAIRRAEREGVTVRRGEQAADLDAFYKLMGETGIRANFGIYSHSYYHLAWRLFSTSGNAHLLIAERGNRALAAALIFAWAGVASYLYGGSTQEGLTCGANHAIQWSAIRWAHEHGCKVYDFWFVPDHFGRAASSKSGEQDVLARSSYPLDGVFRFKKSFGGRVVRYLPAYDRIYVPPLYALWRRRSQA